MNKNHRKKQNIPFILVAALLLIMISAAGAFAASAPNASGKVDSPEGAWLRKSATTASTKLALLKDDTDLTIHEEVFVSKSSTSARKRWYLVTAGGKQGYIRSDLVDTLRFSTVDGTINCNGIYYRYGAGTGMDYEGRFNKGASVQVCLAAKPVWSRRGTSNTWYRIKSGSTYYYVCGSRVDFGSASAPAENAKPAASDTGSSGTGGQAAQTAPAAEQKSGTDSSSSSAAAAAPKTGTILTSAANAGADLDDKKFEDYLNQQGFPEQYKVKLRELHKKHPNWGFVAYKSNINWSDAISRQTRNGASLVHSSYGSSYRSGGRQIEPGWYNASSTVVAYYMDPRNFLTEDRIMMFEDLTYKPQYQTSAVVSTILAPTKLPSKGFTANIFINAAAKNNVSPVFLAARARQEVGGGSDAINGTSVLGTKVYNPFNIGAFGGTNPLYNGLLYARTAGWTTPAKAVEGGAAELSKYYISKGQHTIYYQRFNVRNGAGSVGTHQYMTNIHAPYNESYNTKESYSKYGILDQPLVFEIPIYNGMPNQTKLP